MWGDATQMQPATRYTTSSDVTIAYQVYGQGSIDLLFAPPWITHLELAWEEPSLARFLDRLGSFSRLIRFDRRGMGLSDRVGAPLFEDEIGDALAVLDAVGSERAALLGASEGGSLATLFAATYPQRSSALLLYGTNVKFTRSPDYPWGRSEEQMRRFEQTARAHWGEPFGMRTFAPSRADDRAFCDWWARNLRMSATPATAIALLHRQRAMDIRYVLPTIRLPTLVVHRSGDRAVDVGNGRYLGGHIAGARYVELSGDDHLPFVGDADAVLDEFESFLTGARRGPEPDRALVTVLFTDIVGSTERAAALGDTRWRQVLERHHAIVREQLARFRGREVKTIGDGFLATFDGPARAIRCAIETGRALEDMGVTIRAGLHTGECELLGEDLGGIAVHIGARVAALAGPGEVFVSSTVKDLVVGSSLRFADRGEHALKGVPGTWRLYAVET
jgi:class 3 adenylate cyclase